MIDRSNSSTRIGIAHRLRIVNDSETVATAPVGSGKGCPKFNIYRSEEVQHTAMLFGGGDWRWRLTDWSGAILAGGGGYKSHDDCLAAVEALRSQAGRATVSNRSDRKR